MIWKRARKYGLMPTGLTQNIEELLISERARLMLANSDSLVLLNQTATDASTLQSLFHWSDKHRSYFQKCWAWLWVVEDGVWPWCRLTRVFLLQLSFTSFTPQSLVRCSRWH